MVKYLRYCVAVGEASQTLESTEGHVKDLRFRIDRVRSDLSYSHSRVRTQKSGYFRRDRGAFDGDNRIRRKQVHEGTQNRVRLDCLKHRRHLVVVQVQGRLAYHVIGIRIERSLPFTPFFQTVI